jgi:hypothetical protein
VETLPVHESDQITAQMEEVPQALADAFSRAARELIKGCDEAELPLTVTAGLLHGLVTQALLKTAAD